ncbi:MAG: serine--tRNA ligase [Verrucomicrobia bacterium]|nr:serine--tRNA ligase [Verrucomicrobiota bacterium]MCG2681503.1 serine--tRNA ligase [Kiritimatiellia bacterium]MBU4248267.1 serine--tRNA ligase [Verrucomicrobiota bacterium]MBU4289883.1 serine--tRNA ligase [Verrucomicrobiota bacterium]MBU4428182.1 serine--tRNA ligase [Verrucomicrobiota bacterium]
MLDLKWIREREADAREGFLRRGIPLEPLDALIRLDQERRRLVTDTEALKYQRNTASEEIGKLKKAGHDTAEKQQAVKTIGDRISEQDNRLREIDAELKKSLLILPNLPHATTPTGTGSAENVVVRSWGELRTFPFQPQGHVDIGEHLGILDFTRAARMTSSGFPLYVGAGARLERALIQFMIDLHVKEHGYLEVSPPFVCNSAAMTGTGQLPKMAEDMYYIPTDDLYLVPTAEVPVTNIYREEIIGRPLPVYLVAYSPCFRREAGSAGRETRGLIRVHQFDKVEMVKFVEPATSYNELEKLVANAEDVLQRLGLAYRILALCSGDLSFAAAKCYDIELWAPGQNAWLEVSSCSNFEAFQARRAGIRYRNKAGKVEFVHTLNGSGVALARLVVAILENGQQADGSVMLPEALAPYLGGLRRLEPGQGGTL